MELPPDVAQMMQDNWHPSWLTVATPEQASTFDEAALLAGIEPLEKRWQEVDRESAQQILTHLLHRSLAYDTELMLETTAAWLASQFLDAVGKYETRFASNSAGRPGHTAHTWVPATRYLMDRGIVAIGPRGTALYWVADED